MFMPPVPALSLPSEASAVVRTFLEAADAHAPGLVQALYLVGSVALDDFQPGRSDVDFVAVSRTRLDAESLTAIGAAHASVNGRHPDVAFDGTHLCWADLALSPADCAPAPFSHERRFESIGSFALNPITWYELADHAVPIRGPSVHTSQIWRDDTVLRAWTLENLRTYWAPWAKRYRGSTSDERFDESFVGWGVLGVTRLHYTLATARITSKTGAGHYALDVFPNRWAGILQEALRIRTRPDALSEYQNLSERHQHSADLVDFVVTDALRMGGGRSTRLH